MAKTQLIAIKKMNHLTALIYVWRKVNSTSETLCDVSAAAAPYRDVNKQDLICFASDENESEVPRVSLLNSV